TSWQFVAQMPIAALTDRLAHCHMEAVCVGEVRPRISQVHQLSVKVDFDVVGGAAVSILVEKDVKVEVSNQRVDCLHRFLAGLRVRSAKRGGIAVQFGSVETKSSSDVACLEF